MKKILALVLFMAVATCVSAQQKTAETNDRAFNLNYLDKVARPVIMNLANDELKAKMPVLLSEHPDSKETRLKVAYLEAFGRTLSGIGPWLNLEGGSSAEQKLRNQYRQWTLKALANATNPKAKDYLQWEGGQPLVDASFLALGLIRCPWVWQHLSADVQKQVADALNITRSFTPGYNNWILFSGVIEAFYCKYGLPYDAMRMEYGVREFMEHWYVGDGMFSDGMSFHMDYYNSYVIQPFLSTIIDVVNAKNKSYENYAGKLDKISKRYAELQERWINADGSFPATGRSIAYRGGAFQHLANMAFKKQLPEDLSPAQVRGALTEVVRKTLTAPETFTKNGWLNIGLCGKQLGLADFYITTGSLYLCTEIFLPLGLPETDPYWSAPAQPWSAVKIWSGQDAKVDHAVDLR
jgi:hypothetical protein